MYFDIGANMGRWCMSNAYHCDKIISVEADPEIHKALEKNIHDNMFENKIIPLNYVVTSRPETEIEFYKCVESHTLSTLNLDWLLHEKSRFYGLHYETITCNTISLDHLIELYGLPELIKIDVECGEFDCISSLHQKVDTLCFEWASEMKDIAFSCIDHLKQIGFTKFFIQFQDEYTFRPQIEDFKEMEEICEQLKHTVEKEDWGMIWCK